MRMMTKMKYVLEERFILTEDDPVDAATDTNTEGTAASAKITATPSSGPKD